MKVNVENHGKPVCTIEVSNFDTVLAIKEKIQRCVRIPVSTQILSFNGRVLLNDHHDVAQCQIVNNSCLGLLVSSDRYNPNRNNDQVRHQTQQSPAPSNSTPQIIHGHLQHSQGELLGIQDFPPETVASSRNRTQEVQTEQSLVPSNSTEELFGQDLSMTTQDMQSFWPHVQDSPVMVRSNNNQTEQFPPPSNLTGDIIYGQEWPLMVRSNENQVLQELMNINDRSWTTEEMNKVWSWYEPSGEENLNSQDSPVVVRSNNNESVSLSEIEEFLGIQDFHPVTVESSRNNESSLPSYSTDELLGVQDLPPVMVGSRRNRNQVAQTENSPVASDSAIEVINSPVKKKMKNMTVMVQPHGGGRNFAMEVNADDNAHQDSTVTTQVPQTEQSSSSNSVKENTNIQDSSVMKERIRKKRMVVQVMPHSGESIASKGIPVAVNVKMNDNVKELRNELVKIEGRGELNLPQEGYFLIHKNRVLNEDQSFWVAGVDHNDTIEILPRHLTRGSFNLDS